MIICLLVNYFYLVLLLISRKNLLFVKVTIGEAPPSWKKSRGGQWLSGRVLDWRPSGRGFKPHRHHCVVGLEQDTFILA